MSPSPLPHSGGDDRLTATSGFVSVETSAGRQRLSAQQYADAAALVQPDIVIALHDAANAIDGAKRHQRAQQRSLKWLDQCLAALASGSSSGATGGSSDGHVHGGWDLARRRLSASEVAKRNVAGFVITGVGRTQTQPQTPLELHAAIAASVAALPPRLPRTVHGADTPFDMLAAIAAGADAVHSAWAHALTKAGRAFVARLDMPSAPPWEGGSDAAAARDGGGGTARQQQQQRLVAGVQGTEAAAAGLRNAEGTGGNWAHSSGGTKLQHIATAAPGQQQFATAAVAASDAAELSGIVINLWDARYRRDARPLAERCACAACRDHTRAYTQHLLRAREMAADVLLQAHNVEHCLAFLARVRRSVAGGWFEEYRAWWESGGARVE
ncbi:tRNA-guanine(15) transglycosylase-like protein [Tribonema minus]|uniref:tRNA-guanine(15) transglycosylase-like protein n=1 Tax=Tribonema minus TaxID=303371 RepID=A0A835YWW3_9STRA|nr:tRNA-guanine(15) transglycosylase-like protein [Tribonema minus]